jgi:hypothetical protein
MSTDHRPLTSNHVLTALAILGCPATTPYVPTDRHLPLLLGALLSVVEAEIGELATDADRQDRVLDGYVAECGSDGDPLRLLSLAAHRLDRTAAELDRIVEGLPTPASQVLDVARQASRCAGTAISVHLTAADGVGYRASDQLLQAQLLALGMGITEMINRFNDMVARLDQEQQAG